MKPGTDAKSDNEARQRVRVKETAIGRGVFARRPLAADCIISEIAGQVMHIDFESDYCMDLGGRAVLEPHPPFRFLNHNCDPNCELVLWKRRKGSCKKIPRLWIVATRRIRKGEELTIDYSWPAVGAVPCLCGSERCRGWVANVEGASALAAGQGPV